MPVLEQVSLLWVDDDINELGAYVEALSKEGCEVSIASTYAEAIEEAKKKSYKVILVDIKMPMPGGIEVLRKLARTQNKAALAAFSSYLYLDRYKQQLRALKFDVELIDKALPNVNSDEFKCLFIEPIQDLAKHGVQHTIEVQDNLLVDQDTETDPFDIPLSEYMRKSLAEKDLLQEKARVLAADAIEAEFSKGTIWLLLCGSHEDIVARASNPREILSEQEVMEYAKKLQRAPFQFSSPIHVDDIHWCSKGQKNQLEYYPTVTLKIGGESLNLHFDTGSPMVFISYEKLLELRAIKPTTNFVLGSRGHQGYRHVTLNLPVMLEGQISGQTKDIYIVGQAIRDWFSGPFSRVCDDSCPTEQEFEDHAAGQNCPLRVGLIGRNILIDNELIMILDGVNRKTGLNGE